MSIDKLADRRREATRQQESEIERLGLIHGRLKISGPGLDTGDIYAYALTDRGDTIALYRVEATGRTVEIPRPE